MRICTLDKFSLHLVAIRAGGAERREAEGDLTVWEGVSASRTAFREEGTRPRRDLKVRNRILKMIQKYSGSH